VEASEGGSANRNVGQAYRCFLVRCRLEEGAGPNREPCWRFTVQQAAPDSTRHSFSCLSDVAAHLEAELASCAQSAGDRPRE
jgi:hypothetical protein